MQIKFEKYSNNNHKLIIILDNGVHRVASKNINLQLDKDEVFLEDKYDNIEILVREDIIYPYIRFMDIIKYGHDCGSYKLTIKGLELIQREK